MVAAGVPHREWHPHRFWEYASIMQQLDELQVPRLAEIIDVGSGGSFFPPYLATLGGFPNVSLTDSMKYGDIRLDVIGQRNYYNIELPLYDVLCEEMPEEWTDRFDVTMCISTIEHVDADKHNDALREIWRITKPGGFIFITSDYFRDLQQFEASPSRHLQFTAYTETFVNSIPDLIDVEFVGDTDLAYCGDFVHSYSFVNICLRKN
jgi:SAM-dependent methyltransferase